jgi:hypothetical protein
MAPTRLRFPKLFPAQREILAGARRFNAVAMGESGGKTTLAIDVLLASPMGAINGRGNVAFFAATDEDMVDARRRVMTLIDPLIKRRVNSRRVELLSGNMIDFFSLEKPIDLFEEYKLLVVDDARRIENLLDTWEDVLRPTLKAKSGHAWFFSDAYGKRNDFYRLWRKANTDTDWANFQKDSYSNPYLSPESEKEANTVTETEFTQRFCAQFHDVAIELTSAQRMVGPGESFRQWCERLGRDGLKADGIPFRLDDRPAMAWIYDQIPSTKEEAYNYVLVLMKCAQVGFTVMEMLATIYLGLKFSPAKIGMFMPDMDSAGKKSSQRFMPSVRTIPAVYKLMRTASETGSKGGDGNIRTRRIGESLYFFSWTSGRATTESMPMDVLSFDEVQEMTLEQMEKTRERLSASKVRFTLMGSTANWPDSDIHHWYKRGSQFRFHTECPHCLSRKPLDDYFPECIKFDDERRKHRYVCNMCGGWIDDPQRGEWVPDTIEREQQGEVRIRSIHFPQFLSPTISSGEIIDAYNSAESMKNFFNRKLGKPYLDPSEVPVNLEHLSNCVEHGKAAGIVWKSRAKGTYMGIDQMGNFNVVVIKERLPDGRQAVIHVEEIYSTDPFGRCDELMAAFGVAVCVLEVNPNYNEAHSFANRHPGRVFICNSFGVLKEGMIAWSDTMKLDSSDRRTDEDARDRYTLRIDQYKCMQVSMARFTGKVPFCLFPDPQGLVQEVKDKGQHQMVAVLPRMFHHLTKTALVSEKDDETNAYRNKVKKIGIDPHFSYANLLCDIAWARSHGTTMFILPPEQKSTGAVQMPAEIAALPGMDVQIIRAEQQLGDVCGRCQNFNAETKMCGELQMFTKVTSPACMGFVAVEELAF